jgi:hypothetical protein
MRTPAPSNPDVSPQVLCAWCSDLIRPGALPASHGICQRCSVQLHAELQRRAAAGA